MAGEAEKWVLHELSVSALQGSFLADSWLIIRSLALALNLQISNSVNLQSIKRTGEKLLC